jgi:hypothetical protein
MPCIPNKKPERRVGRQALHVWLVNPAHIEKYPTQVDFTLVGDPQHHHAAALSGISKHLSVTSGGIAQMKIAPSLPQETIDRWSGAIATELIVPL